MADYDHIDPYGGSFKAKLANNWSVDDLRKPFGVGLDSTGHVVKGRGHNGVIRGVFVLTKARKQNEMIDVMRLGEITSFAPTAGTPDTDYGVAGTDYFADNTTGIITAAPTADSTLVGFTVEGSRLVVIVDPKAPASTPPVGLSSPAKAATTVSLAWFPVSGATGYVTQKSLDGGTTWVATTVQPAGTATTVTETGLTTATAYKFRVASIVGGVTGGFSAALSVTTS